MAALECVQCFGRKKTAVAVTYCKHGRGLIKINGCPIELVEPEILQFKAYEPKKEIKAKPLHCEPKKFDGRGARAKFQKSYR